MSDTQAQPRLNEIDTLTRALGQALSVEDPGPFIRGYIRRTDYQLARASRSGF